MHIMCIVVDCLVSYLQTKKKEKKKKKTKKSAIYQFPLSDIKI